MKAVIAATTFLWKKPESNDILKKIQQHAQRSLHDYLTKEDAMKLYDQRLVDSEILYGTLVKVSKESGEFSQVEVIDQAAKDNKGYIGYVVTKDLINVISGYGQSAEKVSVITPTAALTFADGQRRISFGTILDLVSEKDKEYQVATPEGAAFIKKEESQKLTAYQGSQLPQRMITLARQFMELPYVWAGISGVGFDCSGFVYSLHRTNGILIPRDADDQAVGGKQLSYKEAQPGDLLFFAYEKGKGYVHHVGMYIGNDQMIHSQTPGSKVIITKIKGSKYEPELAAVSRYW